MTKGKYAARAALRREDADVRSDIASYQHHVKRLTDENAKLKADLATCRSDAAAESRKLRAMLDEGLSPELIALREELERQRDRSARAEAKRQQVQKTHDRLSCFAAKILHLVTGCTGLEATEAMVAALGEPMMIVGADVNADTRYVTGNQAVALQRVRGVRSKPSIVKRLEALCTEAASTKSERGGGRFERWWEPE